MIIASKAIDVSIIIPAYNAEKTIRDAISSVVTAAGNYTYEILVIDDGSTDRTAMVLAELAAEIPQLKSCCNNCAKGPSGARNAGLNAASGRYIAFLDADDVWYFDHLNLGVDTLEKFSQVDVLIFDQDIVDRNSGKKISTWMTEKLAFRKIKKISLAEDLSLFDEAISPQLLNESFIHLQAIIGRSHILKKAAFDESVSRSEDMDYAISLELCGAKFAYSSAITGVYFRGDGSLTSNTLFNYIKSLEDRIVLLGKYCNGVEMYGFSLEKLQRNRREAFFLLSYGYRKNKQYKEAFVCWRKSIGREFSYRHCKELFKIFISSTCKI
jgi:glycosyltransferase involved in cell wall biosynthesis